MTNRIIRRKLNGSIAKVTHWDHFWVNRETGTVIHKAFTIQYLSGTDAGRSFVWPLSSFQGEFEIAGESIEVQYAEVS